MRVQGERVLSRPGFYDSSLQKELESFGTTHILICGLSPEASPLQPAISPAHDPARPLQLTVTKIIVVDVHRTEDEGDSI